ncbi:unnamed protein product [Allacma fusca]|uniref:BTB domain-containing protein n=1 Tax=Allacma fusca TaxID=39272 RepID=A0A8J2NTR0_9HEXA|nr:unnamed protein product [Allacma fusca]
MASAAVKLCGATELRLERQTIGWSIRGASNLFQVKLLPIWKIKSPPFTSGPSAQTWHLELVQSKNEFVKCILVQDGATTSEDTSDSFPIMSKASEVLQSAANMEFISGAIINNLHLLTRDGHLESFAEIFAKYEETNGWREWAGKFVEKRRKAGLTEYIFGNDCDAYENALPLTYLSENQERFVDNDDILHLQADLVLTKTAEFPIISENQETMSPEMNQRILSNEQLAQRLADFYTTKNYSDVTLLAGDQAFQVHKIILEARAPKLAASLFERKHLADKFCCSEEPSVCSESSGDGKLIKSKVESEVIVIENMSANILQQILRFIYFGSISASDICTLTNLCRESRKFDFHEMAYSCILKTLEIFHNCPSDQRTTAVEALKEMLDNCDEAVFQDRALKLDDLLRLYPQAFQNVRLPTKIKLYSLGYLPTIQT